jgi:pilus assembly protein Flp/PilA
MLARLVRTAADFLRKEDGPTSVEYAVVLALIITVIISVSGIGTQTGSTYTNPVLQNASKPTGS